MRKPVVLGFDIGTSSLRTALFDSGGKRHVETTAQAAYKLQYTPDGGAQLAPEVLRHAARGCLARTLKRYRDDRALRGSPILGVGASCFWHSLVGVAEDGQPATPVYTWADSRCRSHAAALRGQLDERAVHARTGCMLRTSFWPAKLRWLADAEPKLFARAVKWMSPAEWLYREFTGGANCGWSMASGTGLFNARDLGWDEELLALCRIPATALNPLSEDPVQPAPEAELAPELKGVPWFPAIGDGAASNLGSGATRRGFAAINIGTSAALRVMHSGGAARAPFGLFCYRVDQERYLVGGAVSNAGNLRAWCVRELRLDEKQIERALARRPLPEHGLTVLPFWTAERAPDWPEDVHGAISGFTQNTTALDMLQAVTEASYFRLARIADLVLEHEDTPPKFIVSGGIQRSRSSLQRLADVLNQPVHPNDEPEASIKGAAVYVLGKLGFDLPPLRLARPLLPRPAVAERYAAVRAQPLPSL